MDLLKVKEALIRAKNSLSNGQRIHVSDIEAHDCIQEALAELEKPCAISLFSGAKSILAYVLYAGKNETGYLTRLALEGREQGEQLAPDG